MVIGLRVVKTVISIAISIAIARALRLEPAHFAGIISMLAVQPSVYQSLRHTLLHLASALFSSLAAITAALLLGNGALVISAVSLLVMALHVSFKQTTSLTLSVIVAVNTLGMADHFSGGTAAYHQFFLVLIGMLAGTAVNAIHRPMHREREEVLLAKSEQMLRVLLHYVQLDVQSGRMTPYKTEMRKQIEEVRSYIEKGKSISQLIREDRWIHKSADAGAGELFRTYETMVERIRDLVKALQKADLRLSEASRLDRAIRLVLRVQERASSGTKSPHARMLIQALSRSPRPSAPASAAEIGGLFPYYQAYNALIEYVQEIGSDKYVPIAHRISD
ncbi:FUSC family protein [Paenibacillus thermotolerans]|uniref:FUSC family protein n=1 Tax=Paenibacillus thermotolerans TaxID=3027807 RepID=UPI002368AA81|nr:MULTISPECIES: aromatic acid exporter family protein [unclassified Paenibacillus]